MKSRNSKCEAPMTAASLAAIVATALVLSVPAPARAEASSSLLPAEQTHGSVTYLTGGVGADEAKAIERLARNYPLTLEFAVKAQPRAQFLAGVKVTIADHTGKVMLDAVSDGPFLLARLPPGRYTVTAQPASDATAKTRHIQILDQAATRVIFEWNADAPPAGAADGHRQG